MSNIISAVFAPGETETVAQEKLYQWSYGQTLLIEGLELPASYQVDFSNLEFCGCGAIAKIGSAEGVQIPTELLSTGKNVYAFIWLIDATGGRTQYRVTIPVTPRPAPDLPDPSPEEDSAIAEAIAALNSAVEQTRQSAADAAGSADAAAGSALDAEDSATLAESWAVGGTGTRGGEDYNNSRFYAEVAQQGAEKAGYAWFDVNDQTGQLVVTVTDNLAEDVSFEVNENLGTLEVTVNG